MILRALVLLAAMTMALPALGQGNPSAASGDEEVQGFLDAYKKKNLDPPEIVFADYLDEEGLGALRRSLAEYYRYHETGFKHRRAVFEWQLLSSKIIFAVVVLLVLVGLWFSWLQFSAGMRVPPAAKDIKPYDGTDPAGAAKPATTFEASLQGIKVTSPILGVVILALSLAFFYLYLVYIYPIEELF